MQWEHEPYTQRGIGTANEEGRKEGKKKGRKEGRKEGRKQEEQKNGTIKYTRINKWKDALRRCKRGNTCKSEIRQIGAT
jgi:flagellar biosynthesis/type III secretory pathway protein FliH